MSVFAFQGCAPRNSSEGSVGHVQMDNDTEEKDFAPGGDSTYSPIDSSHTSRDTGQNSSHTNLQKGHQNLVFTDPAAFRYLEEDPSTVVLERKRRLTGYEVYVVEQWACSRVHPTFVITTYTGLEQNSVVVGVLSVPTNEEAWSPRLRVYLKAITKYHARKKETPLGTLMVTNLNGFPSALTVIAVPDGDLKKHREDFIVNENLKRLGCSGRAGLSLSPPIGATQAKFGLLYHISDRIPIYNAVIELVKLCQVALMLFGKLAPEYADGLLCDVTEQAINDWWTEIGYEYYNIDPSDGILGPTTVAALLGLLMGARNRLNAYGSPVSKDVFDIVNTKRGIAYFQKSQKLERSRRFDLPTLNRIHRVTAKAASGEGWMVPRAVKSTVAELKGKGGDMVSGREKAGIAAVETLDMETFVQLGSGERFKWLWYGKPRKNNESDVFSNLGGDDGMVFNDNQDGGYNWSGKKRDSVDDDTSLRHVLSDRIYLQSPGSQASLDHSEKDQALRRAVLKNMTDKVTDARNGFGRIRDAVGLRGHRGHQSRHSKGADFVFDDDSVRKDDAMASTEEFKESDTVLEASQHALTPPDSGEQSLVGSVQSSRRGSALPDDGIAPPLYGPDANLKDFERSTTSLGTPSINVDDTDGSDYLSLMMNAEGIRPRHEGRETAGHSRQGSLGADDARAIQKMQEFEGKGYSLPPLRTTRSLPKLSVKTAKYWDRRWPRSLSFTAMVDVLAASVPDELSEADHVASGETWNTALATEKSLAMEGRVMGSRLEDMKAQVATWTKEKVDHVQVYDKHIRQTQANLELVYHRKLDEYTALHDASDELLSQERDNLSETVKDLETLGAKLEYELSALESKVEDVENGVAEFERQVSMIEARAEELDRGDKESQNSWTRWCIGKAMMTFGAI